MDFPIVNMHQADQRSSSPSISTPPATSNQNNPLSPSAQSSTTSNPFDFTVPAIPPRLSKVGRRISELGMNVLIGSEIDDSISRPRSAIPKSNLSRREFGEGPGGGGRGRGDKGGEGEGAREMDEVPGMGDEPIMCPFCNKPLPPSFIIQQMAHNHMTTTRNQRKSSESVERRPSNLTSGSRKQSQIDPLSPPSSSSASASTSNTEGQGREGIFTGGKGGGLARSSSLIKKLSMSVPDIPISSTFVSGLGVGGPSFMSPSSSTQGISPKNSISSASTSGPSASSSTTAVNNNLASNGGVAKGLPEGIAPVEGGSSNGTEKVVKATAESLLPTVKEAEQSDSKAASSLISEDDLKRWSKLAGISLPDTISSTTSKSNPAASKTITGPSPSGAAPASSAPATVIPALPPPPPPISTVAERKRTDRIGSGSSSRFGSFFRRGSGKTEGKREGEESDSDGDDGQLTGGGYTKLNGPASPDKEESDGMDEFGKRLKKKPSGSPLREKVELDGETKDEKVDEKDMKEVNREQLKEPEKPVEDVKKEAPAMHDEELRKLLVEVLGKVDTMSKNHADLLHSHTTVLTSLKIARSNLAMAEANTEMLEEQLKKYPPPSTLTSPMVVDQSSTLPTILPAQVLHYPQAIKASSKSPLLSNNQVPSSNKGNPPVSYTVRKSLDDTARPLPKINEPQTQHTRAARPTSLIIPASNPYNTGPMTGPASSNIRHSNSSEKNNSSGSSGGVFGNLFGSSKPKFTSNLSGYIPSVKDIQAQAEKLSKDFEALNNPTPISRSTTPTPGNQRMTVPSTYNTGSLGSRNGRPTTSGGGTSGQGGQGGGGGQFFDFHPPTPKSRSPAPGGGGKLSPAPGGNSTSRDNSKSPIRSSTLDSPTSTSTNKALSPNSSNRPISKSSEHLPLSPPSQHASVNTTPPSIYGLPTVNPAQEMVKLRQAYQAAHNRMEIMSKELSELKKGKIEMEAELESLSQALFEEANKMVSEERKKRAEVEDSLKELKAEKEALKETIKVLGGTIDKQSNSEQSDTSDQLEGGVIESKDTVQGVETGLKKVDEEEEDNFRPRDLDKHYEALRKTIHHVADGVSPLQAFSDATTNSTIPSRIMANEMDILPVNPAVEMSPSLPVSNNRLDENNPWAQIDFTKTPDYSKSQGSGFDASPVFTMDNFSMSGDPEQVDDDMLGRAYGSGGLGSGGPLVGGTPALGGLGSATLSGAGGGGGGEKMIKSQSMGGIKFEGVDPFSKEDKYLNSGDDGNSTPTAENKKEKGEVRGLQLKGVDLGPVAGKSNQ